VRPLSLGRQQLQRQSRCWRQQHQQPENKFSLRCGVTIKFQGAIAPAVNVAALLLLLLLLLLPEICLRGSLANSDCTLDA